MINLITDNLLAYLYGNFYGLIKYLLKPEKPIWQSNFYIVNTIRKRRIKFGDWLFSFIIVLFLLFFARGLYSGWLVFKFIGSALYLLGILILLQIFKYGTKLYVYHNRFEIKFFLHTTATVAFYDILYVLRTQESQEFATVVYKDKTKRFDSLGSDANGFWKIPIELFIGENAAVKVDRAKLDKNLFSAYDEVKNSLSGLASVVSSKPGSPADWKTYSIMEKIQVVLFFFFNPYSVLVMATTIFGFNFTSPYLFLITEFSRVLTAYNYQKLVAVNRKLNIPFAITNHQEF